MDRAEVARVWGARIKARRLLLRLTQTDLAKLMGVEQATVSRWELGEGMPRLYDAVRLAETLSAPGLFDIPADSESADPKPEKVA
jgi:transcriptional regulator with XRE-family HTH domain